MGIYIKTLKIPETCRDCFLFETCKYGNKLLQCRADECPIEETSATYGMEELPASHGRLIDADVLIKFIKNQHVPKFDIETGNVILQMIDKMYKYSQQCGTWIPCIKKDEQGSWDAVMCSNCRSKFYKWQKTNFCSTCGTRMIKQI